MPIFGLGKKKSGIDAKPEMVPGDGDPVAAELVVAGLRHNLPAVRAILTRYDGDSLSILVSQFSKHCVGAYDWLRGDPEFSEKSGLDQLLLGSATVALAWRTRTGARAQHVSRERFAKFHTLLREAEEHLYAAAELEPSSAAPWAQLITSGRGLQIGIDINRRRFEAAVRHCPEHRIAHQQMLQSLCQKWSGSHEQMHEFAADAITGPHWSALAHLVAIAHIERWLSFGLPSERAAYMRRPKVRAELEEAADLSIFSDDAANPRSPHFDANLFAMAFGLAGMYGEAERAFELAHGIVTRFPWEYLNAGDPVLVFAQYRSRARQSS